MDTASTAYLMINCNERSDGPPRRRPRLQEGRFPSTSAWARNLAVLTVSLLALGGPVLAQPAGRVLSGYPPGGAVDILARVVAEEFSRSLGRTFIVDTKAGAGGQIAVDTLKQAAPDGGTFLVAAETNMVIYPHTVQKPTYNTPVDFIPVAQVATYDIAFASKADARVTDFASWVNLARRDADAATFASPGAGSNMHFFGVVLGDSIGRKLQHVPYRGTGPAVNDTAAGVVATVLSPVGPMLQFHDQKRLRILAISGPKRSERVADVPTFAELGFPKLTQTGWFGLFAPAGTSPDVIAKAHAALAVGLKRPEVRARIAGMDMQIPTLDQQEFSRLVASEYTSWGNTVKATGFTAEGQ